MPNTLDNLISANTVLAGDAQENLAAEQLRLTRNAQVENQEEPQSLREAVRSEKRKREAQGALAEKVEPLNPAKIGSGLLLRTAWKLVFSVYGFLPALAYLNIHVGLRWILGDKIFCKLGDEWISKKAGSNDLVESVGKGAGLIEVIGIILLDLLVLFAVIGIIAIIAILVDFLNHPLDAIWSMITGMLPGGGN